MYLSYFSGCYDKIPDLSNLRKEGFILGHSWRVQPFVAKKAWCQEHEIVVTFDPQSVMGAGAQLTFSCVFIQS